jgi:hypothetical protein
LISARLFTLYGMRAFSRSDWPGKKNLDNNQSVVFGIPDTLIRPSSAHQGGTVI